MPPPSVTGPSVLAAPGGAAGLQHGAPLLVAAPGGPWPLHDRAASRRVEAAALAAHAPQALMEAAGLAAARLALALAPHAQRVLVLAGAGNNGGDGLVAARRLQQAGRQVAVRTVGDLAAQPADAAVAWRKACASGVQVHAFDAAERHALRPDDIAIDALLGLGTTRAPDGRLAQAIQDFNALPCARLAIDLPSGLSPDSGALLGAQAIHADATLCLLTLKPGCFTGAGRDHVGAVWWSPLGLHTLEPTAWLAGPLLRSGRADFEGGAAVFGSSGVAGRSSDQCHGSDRSAGGSGTPWRMGRSARGRHLSHKGSFGDVLVVGGAPGMTGAAWLCAGAALSAGAGRVHLSLLSDAAPPAAMAAPELMLRHAAWRLPPARLRGTTVVAGSGGGNAVAATLPALLAHAGRLVLDADALNAVAGDASLQRQLQARGHRGLATVLTPHPLEAARLLGCTTADVQFDRLSAAARLAAACDCCVVVKGSGTVVAAPGQPLSINPTGNAALATAGTGDVLAGWIGGLWAEHTGDASWSTAARVAATACWLHGAAADNHRAAGLHGPLLAGGLAAAMAALRV